MAQRHVQHMMRDKAHLFRQGQKVKPGAIADGLACRRRRTRAIAVTAPECEDRECRIDLSQMGDGRRGAGRMPGHGSPKARRSAA